MSEKNPGVSEKEVKKGVEGDKNVNSENLPKEPKTSPPAPKK